jgi:hypothetical protein
MWMIYPILVVLLRHLLIEFENQRYDLLYGSIRDEHHLNHLVKCLNHLLAL